MAFSAIAIMLAQVSVDHEQERYHFHLAGLKAQRSRYAALMLILLAMLAYWLSVETLQSRYMAQFDDAVSFHRRSAALEQGRVDALAAGDASSKDIQAQRSEARARAAQTEALSQKYVENARKLADSSLEIEILGTSLHADPVVAPLILLVATAVWVHTMRTTLDFGALHGAKLAETFAPPRISEKVEFSKSLWLVWPVAAESPDTQVIESRYDARRANALVIRSSLFLALATMLLIAWRAFLVSLLLTSEFARKEIGLEPLRPTGWMTFVAILAFLLFLLGLFLCVAPHVADLDRLLVKDRRALLLLAVPAVGAAAWIGFRRQHMPSIARLNRIAPTDPELAAQEPICRPGSLFRTPRFDCSKPVKRSPNPAVVLEQAVLSAVQGGRAADAIALLAAEMPSSLRRARRAGKPMPWRLLDLHIRLDAEGANASRKLFQQAIATLPKEAEALRVQEMARLDERRSSSPKGPWHAPHQSAPPHTFGDFLLGRQPPLRAIPVALPSGG